MGVIIISTIVLVVIAAITNAIMDILQQKYKASIFSNLNRYSSQFWNPKLSWKNKWKWSEDKQTFVEKFPLSSTVLVWTTDAWHLMQMIFHTSWQLAIAINTPNPVLTFVVLKTINSGVFELITRYFLVKR